MLTRESYSRTTNGVLVSRTTQRLGGGVEIEFADRGMRTLKGVPEPWQVFAARC
jgi:class 3 adenylate cyclase